MPVASATRVSPLNAPTVRHASTRPASPNAASTSARQAGEVGRVEVRGGGEVEQQCAAGHTVTASECGCDVELVAER